MKLNKEELAIGALFGAAFWPFLGWWTLFFIPAEAVLWALGGSVNKAYRRFGCAFLGLLNGIALWWLAPFGYAAVFTILSLGYGVPSQYPPDSGSVIGRFFYELLGENEIYAQAATRAFIGFLFALCFLPLAFVNLWGWLCGAATLTLGMPLIATFVEGEITP